MSRMLFTFLDCDRRRLKVRLYARIGAAGRHGRLFAPRTRIDGVESRGTIGSSWWHGSSLGTASASRTWDCERKLPSLHDAKGVLRRWDSGGRPPLDGDEDLMGPIETVETD